MMDRRTQRLLLVLLAFGLVVVLYRNLGAVETGRWSREVDPEDRYALRTNTAKLEAANSTLGVSLRG
jgi:hypothetical protein